MDVQQLVTGRAVDIVADFGADPTGESDDTGAFARAVAELRTAGGGTIVLRPNVTHNANISLTDLEYERPISLVGGGLHTIVRGLPDANKPVIDVDIVGGHGLIRDLKILGTRPLQDVSDGRDHPEIGLHARGTLLRVQNLWIQDTRGDGLRSYTGIMRCERISTFWTGGRGLAIDGFDSIMSECLIGGAFTTESIRAASLLAQWVNCRAYGGGQKWDPTLADGRGSVVWDNDNSTHMGWDIYHYQQLSGCYADDSHIGFRIMGNNNRIDGSVGSCKIPLLVPEGEQHNNLVDISVFPTDRWTPRVGARVEGGTGGRYRLAIGWDSLTMGNHEQGQTIRNQPGFGVFDVSPGAQGGSNEFEVVGANATKQYSLADTAVVTPDIIDGTTYLLDGTRESVRINAPRERQGLPTGARLRFIFSDGPEVDWDGAYVGPTQPGPAGAVIEFMQIGTIMAPRWAQTLNVPATARP